jgi:hypothetical protein
MPTNKNKVQTKALAIPLVTYNVKNLLESLGFILAIIVAPLILAHTPANQWITGTVVNALIFFACYRLGVVNASLIAILPSFIAAVRGLLPAPLLIMIPYIILANLTLILSFSLIKLKSNLIRVALAAFLKFLLLFSVITFLIKLPEPMASMMSWPQFITALAGGLIFVLSLKGFQLNKKQKS